MQIRRVHAVYFSGTGTTEKTVRRIAAQAAQQLGAELSAMDFTPPQARQETLHFAPEELVIFGVPTYAGRVPNVLLPFLKERVPYGLLPHVQAMLLARHLRGDLDGYPPFFWN